MNLHKTNMGWLVHSWSTFGAKTSHGATLDSQDSPRPGLGGSHQDEFIRFDYSHEPVQNQYGVVSA
jgi:hypothetical protein